MHVIRHIIPLLAILRRRTDHTQTTANMPADPSEIWRCVTGACPPSAAPQLATRDDVIAIAADPAFRVDSLPSSSEDALVLVCSTCSTPMVACECCNLLVDATSGAMDGVLLCKRCGFLTVVAAPLRRLMQIPPFSRAILGFVTPFIAEVENLKQQYREWESQIRRYSEPGTTPAITMTAATGTPYRQAKRKASVLDEVASPPPQANVAALPPSAESRDSTSRPSSVVRAEGKQLQTQLHLARQKWRRVTNDAERDLEAVIHQQQPRFSSTDLLILKSVYEKKMPSTELAELSALIDQFLLHQSTIIASKNNTIAALHAHRLKNQLDQVVSQAAAETPLRQATDVVFRCSAQQLQHFLQDFDNLARPYLRLVSITNKHLFALFNAALSLSRIQNQESLSGATATAGPSPSPTVASPPSMPMGNSFRGQRSFGRGVRSADGRDSVSDVQQRLEMSSRVNEIAKKVALWRTLSGTIASTCMLTLIELAQIEQATGAATDMPQ